MSESPSTSVLPERRKLRRPLIFLALPLIVYFPYWWLMHDVLAPSAARGPITAEHMRVHYGAFWALTYFPFCVVCFITAVVMLINRFRFSVAARWLLVPVALVAAGVLVLAFLILTGH